jgi:hypothetical protein
MIPVLRLLLIGLLLVALPSVSQTPDFDLDSVPHFAASHEITLAGSGTKWTLHVPANSASRVYIVGVTITCDVACEVTQSQNGTTPTGTAVTGVMNLNLPDAVSVATLYRSSDSTGGTSLTPIPLQAGIPMAFKMKASFSRGQSTAQNYSFAVSSITGKARAHWIWAQKGR